MGTNPAHDPDSDVAVQYQQAARWANLLISAGYPCELRSSGQRRPRDYEWRVYGPGWLGPEIATIGIDGFGACWVGPEDIFRDVIGSVEGALDLTPAERGTPVT